MSETSDDFKLPIGDAIGDVYRFLWSARRDLVFMAAIPIVALTVYQVIAIDIFGIAGPNDPELDGARVTLLDVLILYVPSLLLYAMFAVAWHRRYLMRFETTTVWSALRWDGRKTRFVLRTVLVTLMSAAIVTVPIVILTIFTVVINFAAAADVQPPVAVSTLSSGVAIAAGIMFMIVYLRLSIWLPATAVDAPFSLIESWRMGRGNSWRLLAIACGSEVCIWILFIALNLAVAALPQGSLTIDLVVELARNTLAYATLAAGITALSVCYDRLLARMANDPLYAQNGMPFTDD